MRVLEFVSSNLQKQRKIISLGGFLFPSTWGIAGLPSTNEPAAYRFALPGVRRRIPHSGEFFAAALDNARNDNKTTRRRAVAVGPRQPRPRQRPRESEPQSEPHGGRAASQYELPLG